MVQGAVTDFFKQTVMDFQYGQMSLAALERYNEDLAAQDPSEGHRLARVRASAIESCASLVLSEGEEKLGGWTLFSPIEPNRVQSPKLEEKVVLLVSMRPCEGCERARLTLDSLVSRPDVKGNLLVRMGLHSRKASRVFQDSTRRRSRHQEG